MNKELSKTYNPLENEDKIYEKWEKSGYFNPDNLPNQKEREKKGSYTITLPPPNITDKLHLGHSAMLAIEDLLIRYHRMKGYLTLWMPGTDHAAIATQNVVEKKLLKEKGIGRHDLGREKFLDEVWSFLKETQSVILSQTRKMGASLDWSRQAFTLDDERKEAVQKMFIEMYEAEVVYRGERVVNWCPRCNSTLADDEVEYKAQRAKLYTFKYDKDFPISVSTTRPETKLGDTAVAVNPKDTRYKKYIGEEFKVKFCGIDLNIKIIGDRNVDMEFGTGALGVTPAHSVIDEQMSKEHGLASVKVINEDGKIREGFNAFSGKTAKEARKMIVKKLETSGLLEAEEEIDNNLSICYRCDTPIEPLPSKQWFISVDKKLDRFNGKSLKEKAIEVAEKKEISFIPDRFEKRYLDWMNNLHDWCISRQIWFGHRIPVWYKGDEIHVGEEIPKGSGWKQDSGTLDTWFSSGMWTFSTLGWPDNFKNGKKSGDLKKFHPTQVLETGYEIITLWVSRMIMMSLFALNEIPFENVYLHGMVLDEKGKKMSKSKGNGIDPVDVINQFGTDAVRLSLLIGNTPGNDLKIGEKKIESYRNFTNKLWNISRYILSTVDLDKIQEIDYDNLSSSDKWILNGLNNLIKDVGTDLDEFNFSSAGEKLKDYTWNSLADWYLEMSKFEDKGQKDSVLIKVLETLLKLWHPFVPFVTETIWENMNKNELLMIAEWPNDIKKLKAPAKELNSIDLVISIIEKIRNARAENKVEPAKKIKAVIYAHKNFKLLTGQEILIKSLKTGISDLEIKEKGDKIDNEIYITVGEIEIYLLGGIDKEKEAERISKEIENLENMITNSEKKLSNEEFVGKAPKNVVKAEKDKLSNWQTELEKIKNI